MNEFIIFGMLCAVGMLLMAVISIVENIDLIREVILDALVYVIDKLAKFGRYMYWLVYDIGTAYCKFKHNRKRRNCYEINFNKSIRPEWLEVHND